MASFPGVPGSQEEMRIMAPRLTHVPPGYYMKSLGEELEANHQYGPHTLSPRSCANTLAGHLREEEEDDARPLGDGDRSPLEAIGG